MFIWTVLTKKAASLLSREVHPANLSVTQFGRSLEFSSGLFSDLSIETQRKVVQGGVTTGGTGPKSQVIEFTIRCAYTPEKSGSVNVDSTIASKSSPNQTTAAKSPSSQLSGAGAGGSSNSETPKVAQKKTGK